MTFPEAIVLPENASRAVQVILSSEGNGDRVGKSACQVLSLTEASADEAWNTHATATLNSQGSNGQATRDVALAALQETSRTEEPVDVFYQIIWDGGIQLDRCFRWVERLWTGNSAALCRMRSAESGEDEAYALPPGLVDSCFQAVAATIPGVRDVVSAYVPFGIDRLHLAGRPRGRLWCHAALRPNQSAGSEVFSADVRLFEESGRVVADIAGLHLKKANRETLLRGLQVRQEDWLYEIAWRPLAPLATPAVPSGSWLVVADRGGIGAALTDQLRQQGASCVLALAEDTGATPDADEYVRLLNEATAGGTTPLTGIVFLRALDAEEADDWLSAQQTMCGSALALIQAVLRSGSTPALWLVTRGAVSLGANALVRPTQATLWGLGRTLTLEHPDLRCVCLDLDPTDSATPLAEILAPPGAEQVAVRAGVRHGARLQRATTLVTAPVPLRADACYLITGGLGDLGLKAARQLVAQGARHLILVGRNAPSPAAQQVLAELEKSGVRLLVAQADSGVRADLERVLQEAAVMPPLRGILHAAGVLDNAVLLEQDWAKFARVLAPKVAGAWHLHQLTRALPLDFFVLYSSAAALLGSPGQANYAAANAFLDALAHRRRAEGLPALSINWGPWDEGGMAARVDERQKQRWQAQGVGAIPPDRGVELLGRLLGDTPAQLGVLVVDWVKFFRQFAGRAVPPVLSELTSRSGPTQEKAGEESLLPLLEAAPPEEREELLLEHVRGQAARVLRVPPERPLDARQSLNELGMDSLMAVELRNRLGVAVGRTLPATLLFNHPTVAQLAAFLGREFLDLKRAPAVVKPTAPAPSAHEPIAIIGLACRLPGAPNADAYWDLLHAGRDAVTEVPPERWDVDAYYDANPDAPGKMYTRRAGFLTDVDQFDAAFFGIAPREAVNMDPQQRLLLEVSWEALENAGLAPDRLAGSSTAVYVGISTSDYAQMQLKGSGLAGVNAYTGTGNAFSVAAGRVSYVFGLQGPNFPVDTACSSSLLAVHLACQSLRSGESTLALAAGVNLILTPEGLVYFCKLRALAPDGRCKTFDARADGYVRGEGCGVVVLKRLSDARRDGDRILAVVRGSAVNHDGRSNGLTAPNGAAQEAVLRAALADAGVEPRQVAYIEAHGTGTALGDPIEVSALAAVLGPGHTRDTPFLLGSAKTNIGHLEAAAGVAGIIKVVLALRHATVPPHVHFEQPSPLIPWDDIPVRIPTAPTPWPTAAARIAGVSSFGFSGTNVHIVLEAAPDAPALPATTERPLHLLTLSARTPAALSEQARQLALHLETHPEATLADICYTANTGRATLPHRLTLVSQISTEAGRLLSAFEAGAAPAGLWSGQMERERPPRVAFLFTGQGAQYVGMARRLSDTSPTFCRELDRCAEILRPHLERPLLDVLFAPEGTPSPLSQTAYAQPALFAVGYALAMLWQSWGVRPAAALGHSLGEYTAACVAGVLSLEDALVLVATRARLMQALPAGGGMAAVLADETRVTAALRPFPGRLGIAALNGPTNTVISGDSDALTELLTQLSAEGVAAQRLDVSHAFHSHRLEPMLAELERVADSIVHAVPRIRLVANLTGKVAPPGELCPAYWARHARAPVRFADSITTLRELGCEILLELGPQPTLTGMVRRCLPEDPTVACIASLRRGQDDWRPLLDGLANLSMRGVPIDWAAYDADYPRCKVSLPTYPFQRQRYWLEADGLHGPNRAAPAPAQRQDWLYDLTWQPAPLPPLTGSEPGTARTWLIYSVAADGGYDLARQLEEHGDRCVRLSGPSELRLAEIDAGNGHPLHGVVFLANGEEEKRSEAVNQSGGIPIVATGGPPVDGTATGEPPVATISASRPVVHSLSEVTLSELAEAQRRLCGAALELVQSLARLPRPPRLWLVTRSSQAVGTAGPLAVEQASLWGLGRVLAQEHPELRCVCVDVEQADGAELVEELVRPDGEDQTAWRGGQRFVPRLERSAPSASPSSWTCRADATYLITGGLGAIGLCVARRLVDGGARHLVLVGRRGATEDVAGTLDELRQQGAEIVICAADIAVADDVARVLAEVDRMPPLRGVLHAAGVLDDGVLLQQTWPRFQSVLAPKVAGAWNLHLATRDRPLDFFVLFSSVASLLGTPGQASYAAANAFLDARLAHHRRALALPALAVNWGPWADVGMAADLGEREQRRLAARGLGRLTPTLALDALGGLLSRQRTQSCVLNADWPTVFRQTPTGRTPAILARLKPTDSLGTVQSLRTLLEQTPPGQGRLRLTAYLGGEVARILGLDVKAIDPNRPLMESGLDSLMAVELRNVLAGAVAQDLPATLMFDHPTVARLADFLANTAFADLFPVAAPTAVLDKGVDQARLLAEVADLSAADMEALIDEELARLKGVSEPEVREVGHHPAVDPP